MIRLLLLTSECLYARWGGARLSFSEWRNMTVPPCVVSWCELMFGSFLAFLGTKNPETPTANRSKSRSIRQLRSWVNCITQMFSNGLPECLCGSASSFSNHSHGLSFRSEFYELFDLCIAKSSIGTYSVSRCSKNPAPLFTGRLGSTEAHKFFLPARSMPLNSNSKLTI